MKKKFDDLQVGEFGVQGNNVYFCIERHHGVYPTVIALPYTIPVKNICIENELELLEKVPPEIITHVRNSMERMVLSARMDNLSYIEALATLNKYV